MVKEHAYAKINLFLDVINRREDGFHDIVSIMQSVSLCDTVLINATKSDKTNIVLTCSDESLPLNNDNLIYKAAEKYLSYYGLCANVEIHLEKLIPIGAGLGGGSSDAAATLRGLDCIFKLSRNDDLIKVASELGSDVPFCLLGGRALCTGRGEKMEAIVDFPFNYFVIAIGKERVSTPKAYRALDEKYSNFDGSVYTPVKYSGQLYNIFESVTDIAEIQKIKENMIKSRAESSLMSGSGPSVFGLFKNESEAIIARDKLLNDGFSAFYCHTVKGEL